MIRDFLGIVELRIVIKVKAPWKGWKSPNLQLKGSSRRQLGDLLLLVKQLCIKKRLLLLVLEDAFYS